MNSFIYYFWSFVLGAFLGVISETIWCMIRYKKLESRKGLIYGPFNPLYGFATMFISLLINLSENKSIGNIYIMGVVVASIIEYLCSYYQEKYTGAVSWDYKDFKYNLNGRINLVYSMIWGLFTLFWFTCCMPLVDFGVEYLINVPKITIFCFILMFIDCLISLSACVRRKNRHNNVPAKSKIAKRFDYIYNDERLEKVYPNSKFTDK